jgi:beta-phosphoglucomutase family hydrolase
MQSFGVIFDWDGVIVDSSSAHELSWERVAEEERLPLPEGHFRRGFGMKNEVIIPELLEWTRVPEEIIRLSRRKEAIYRDVIKEQGITVLPGVTELLDHLESEGIRTIIGSSAHLKNIEAALDVIGLHSKFGGVVSSEDVRRGKPDPEVFLVAAHRLGYPPQHCVVVEDAIVGIQAARAAGCGVLAVATTHPTSELRAADRICATLEGLRTNDFCRILEARPPVPAPHK